ncbi:MAG: hypothetical protein KGN77_05065 [Xanthomonadaceae bacterium]|nr:hypothetical protein [Xanthomonadaceae bacterium]
MSLRFTETSKWVDPWFRRLPCHLKLLWVYLCDNCDIAGVVELDPDKVAFEIGTPVDLSSVPSEYDGRVRALPKPIHWFLPKFVGFQFKGRFDPVNDRYARGVVMKLRHNMLTVDDLILVRGHDGSNGGYLAPQGKDNVRVRTGSKRDLLVATLRGLGMPSTDSAAEGWSQLCRKRAKCSTAEDALAFIEWAVRRGLKDGVNVQWSNQAAVYADEWATRPKAEGE